MTGQIIKQISNQYTILTEDQKRIDAIARGKLRHMEVDGKSSFYQSISSKTKKETQHQQLSPKVGDIVTYSFVSGHYLIEDIHPRKTDLWRNSPAESPESCRELRGPRGLKMFPGLIWKPGQAPRWGSPCLALDRARQRAARRHARHGFSIGHMTPGPSSRRSSGFHQSSGCRLSGGRSQLPQPSW